MLNFRLFVKTLHYPCLLVCYVYLISFLVCHVVQYRTLFGSFNVLEYASAFLYRPIYLKFSSCLTENMCQFKSKTMLGLILILDNPWLQVFSLLHLWTWIFIVDKLFTDIITVYLAILLHEISSYFPFLLFFSAIISIPVSRPVLLVFETALQAQGLLSDCTHDCFRHLVSQYCYVTVLTIVADIWRVTFFL